MRYLLGIDQGGTKTAAAIMCEDGTIIGTAVAKGAYYPKHGVPLALDRMEEAGEAAWTQAGIRREDISLVVAGVTGIDWPGEDKFMEDALRRRMHLERVTACNDMINALYTVKGISHGMVLCAGTGMNGAIIDETGRQFVYGDYMEDAMQGGSALAQRAIRKVFDAQMGLCGSTALTDLFLRYAGVDTVDELLHVYMTKEGFAEEIRFLMPDIIRIAGNHDRETCHMLEEFAARTVDFIFAGFRKMDISPNQEKIVLAGSVLKGKDNYLTRQILEKIKERELETIVVKAEYEPVVGACVMGLRSLQVYGVTIEQNIDVSAREWGLCLA